MMEIETTMETEAPTLEMENPAILPPIADVEPAAEPESFSTQTAIQPAEGPPSLEAVYDVPVRVQAILGRSRMPVSELMKLKAGHVVELDRKVGEPVDIFVNDRLIARGEVVMIDNALGVTLTEIVRQDD